MKKCPFCAEEIQDAAIKCRFCGSMLDGSAAPAKAESPPAKGEPKSVVDKLKPQVEANKMIYDGSPSWKAYLGQYLFAGFSTLALVLILPMLSTQATFKEKALEVVVPIGLAALFYFGLGIYRRALKFRVTTTSIEIERGILAKRINVVQLWRIKDVVYRQNLIDRLLQIAHIEVLSQDDLIKDLEIFGMPASRQLFEQLRDSIEIQRQAKNVIGVVS